MGIDPGAGIELAIRDIDVSKCRINHRSCRDSDSRGHVAPVNVGARYSRTKTPLPQLPATIGIEGINTILLGRDALGLSASSSL